MNTETLPDPATAPVQAALFALLARFTGYRYRFLLALVKDPTRTSADVCRELGIEPQTAWNWHSMVPGFKEAVVAIKEDRPQLRQEYARLAMEGAIPNLVDKMIEVGGTDKRDAQRARERILETVGVLPKPGADVSAPQVQVNTYTYYLVQPGHEPTPYMVETSTQGVTVEGVSKALDAPEP